MSVKKNLIYNITYQILILFLPLVTTPYISRVIGAEGIGIYSYTYSIVNYFILFAMLGLNNYGNRSIASVRDNKIKLSKTFCSIYVLQVMTTLLMMFLYIVYTVFFVSDHLEIAYTQLLFLVATVLDINWFFFGLEQFKLTVIRNTLIKVFTVLFIFIFIKDANDLWVYTVIMAVGTLISQLTLWPFIRRYVTWIKPTFKEVISHIKPNLTLFIPVLAISIYKIMDKIMLGIISSSIQVGYYENSEKIISIPLSIITALGAVMLPRMTNLLANGDNQAFKKYIEISLKFVMFIAMGGTVGLIGILPRFIPLFLGNGFIQCITITSLLSITILCKSWANVIRTQYLIPREKDKIYIKSTILGAIINVTVNLVFIPLYGAVGAAIGTIFAEASVALYQTIKVRKEINIYQYFKNSCLYVVPAMTMYFIIINIDKVIENTILCLTLQVTIGGIVYVILCGCLLCYTDLSFRRSVSKFRLKYGFSR